ncbi:MAG TPA: hypothetical protein G4O02_13460 [Caldilineae bacterium]|jgi:hypothetical protein|nr:hypothetical protein [Caldilineae bacterium]
MEQSINKNGHGRWQDEEHFIQTELDPIHLVELQMLQGKAVQGVALWSKSIADEELAELDEDTTPEHRVFVDFDLYLEGHILLEVYAASVYRNGDEEPMVGLDVIANALGRMTERGAVLGQVTTDEADGLVLVLTSRDTGEALTIAPSGWALAHWDELPDDVWVE